MFFKILVLVFYQWHICSGAQDSKTFVPQWVDLECQVGYAKKAFELIKNI